MKKKESSPLWRRVAPYGVAALLLSLLIVLADIRAYREYRRDIVETEQKQLLLMAETVGSSLKDYLELEIDKLDLYFSLVTSGTDQRILEELVDNFLSRNRELYLGAQILDREGKPVKSTLIEPPPVDLPQPSGEEARIVGKRLAYTGWYEMYIRKPVSGGGSILFSVDLNRVYQRIVAPIRIGQGGYSVVKDRDMAIIMHHARSQIGMDAIYDRSLRYPDLDLRSLQGWIDLQTRQEEGYSVIDSYVWDDPGLTPLRRIVAYTTIHIQDEHWIVNSTLPMEELAGPLQRTALVIVGVSLLCFLAIVAVAVALTRTLAREIAQRREINYLREINRGMELAAKQREEIRHYQRVQSLGMMSSHIAHEFNNYLTPVAVYAELMEGDEHLSEEDRSMVREMLGCIEKAKALSRSLLEFARQDTGSVLKPLNLTLDAEAAFAVVKQLTPQAITLTAEFPEETLFVLGREGMTQHILMNLCKNAFSAMEDSPAKELRIRLERQGDQAVLRVRDSGCGISKEAQQRIFEPFYTTKGSRQGTGLGLSVVRNIVTGAGGQIAVESEPGQGTEIVMTIPLHREEEETDRKVRRVLLVDGDLASLGQALAGRRKAVEVYDNPGAALSRLQNDPERFQAVVAGYVLPTMDGVEFLELVRGFSPRSRLILMTHQEGTDLEWYVNNRILDRLIRREELAGELDRLLG